MTSINEKHWFLQWIILSPAWGFHICSSSLSRTLPTPPNLTPNQLDCVWFQIITTKKSVYQALIEIEVLLFFITRKPKQGSFRLVCGSMKHLGFQALSNFLIHNPQWVEVVLRDKIRCCLPGLLPLFQSKKKGEQQKVKQYFSLWSLPFLFKKRSLTQRLSLERLLLGEDFHLHLALCHMANGPFNDS